VPPVTDRIILHFTDVANLASIVQDEGLYSDVIMTRTGRQFRECAEIGIKETRRNKAVPVEPYGCVGDYVPFYYAPRSPMMSAISHGKVPGYTDSRSLAYFVSSIARVSNAGLRWVCTDGNARTGITEFYNTWLELESQTDWELMTERYWANTTEDGDRKRRRAAEFLVRDFFPLSLTFEVVVHSQQIAQIARETLPSGLAIHVKSDYYPCRQGTSAPPGLTWGEGSYARPRIGQVPTCP